MMRRISRKLALAFVTAVLAVSFSLPSHAQSAPLSGFDIGALPNPVGDGFYTTITGVVFGSAGEPTPDGQIDFFISYDPTDCLNPGPDIGTGSVNSSGLASVSYYADQPGALSICGNYTSSESGYAPATAGPFVLTVYAPTSMFVFVPSSSVPGAAINYNVVLTTPSGQPAPQGQAAPFDTITLYDYSANQIVGGPTAVVSYTLNGQTVLGAQFNAALLNNDDQYEAVYSGDSNYVPQSVVGTIFLENPLTSVNPASFIAGATIPTASACTLVTGGPGLQLVLNGFGFAGGSNPTTAQFLIQIPGANGVWQSLQVSPSTANPTTQLIGCLPATAVASVATILIETNTPGQTETGGPVTFQVYAPWSLTTEVSSTPSTFAYGSNLATIINGLANQNPPTQLPPPDPAVPAGTVTFDLTGTSGTETLGTGLFTQSTTTTGSYQSPLMAPFDTNSTEKVIAADLIGNGYVDVVGMPGTEYGIGSPATSAYLQVFLSTGTNAFQTEEQIFSGCPAQDFAVGDIHETPGTGNGYLDLVVVCPGAPGSGLPLLAYYMLGNGDGTFQAPVPFGSGSYVSSPTQVVLGNFNGDGYNDIAVIDGVDGYLMVISPFGTNNCNNSTYQCNSYVYFNTGYGPVFSAGAADFNQDGYSDIVLGEYSPSSDSGALLPLINSGGSASCQVGPPGNDFCPLTPAQFNASTEFISSMTVTDVNGDGYPDVAIADSGGLNDDAGSIFIFQNDGSTGNLSNGITNYPVNSVGAVAGAPFPIAGQPAPNAAVAPGWNLVYSAYGSSDGDIFVGQLQLQDGTWSQANPAVDTGTYPLPNEGPPIPGFIVTGDLNGDGYLDFAATGFIYDDGAPSGSLEELVPYYYGNDAQVTLTNASLTPTAGTYTLTMLYPGNQLFQANNTATATITIAQATPTISWTPPAAITYGTPLSATQLDASASTPGSFVYSPASGTVLTAGTQQLNVTFTPTDTTDYVSGVQANVSIVVNQATATVTLGGLNQSYTGSAISATATTNPAGLAVTFTYNGSATAPTAPGTYTVVGTISDPNYQGSATGTLTIAKATATVTLGGLSQTYTGSAIAATATTNPAGLAVTFTYNGSATAPTAAGTYTVVGTISNPNYQGSATGTLKITQAAPTVTWNSPAAIIYGTALGGTQLDANASVPGTFVYNPGAGTVLTAGTHTLGVTFTPTDNTDYTTATATASLTVNQATPAISWTAPAAINYGTALSGTQLDASSTVAGTFVYTPAAGAVLNPGAQTLSVTLTPTDNVDYKTATKTVSLTVNPPPTSYSGLTENVGTASTTQTAGFVMPAGFTLGSIEVVTQGAPNLDFTLASGGTCTVGTAYTVGEACTVGYIFKPTAPGNRMGAILLYDNTSPTPVLEATVYLDGTGIGPLASFSPGIISTVAGDGIGGYNGDNILATNAELYSPYGVAVDSAGNLYIADASNNRIREVSASTGIITTVAGGGSGCTAQTDSIGDGCPATSAELNLPWSVAVDGAGNLYISDRYNNRIRKVDSSGTITTMAGNGTFGYSGDGGPATNAELRQTWGVAVDSEGNVFIADEENERIRKVTVSTGIITTVAGNGANSYSGDGGPATSAALWGPTGVALDSSGNLYIGDTSNNRIREVNATTGIITTVAGSGPTGLGAGGNSGDGGQATSAELNEPEGVATDSAGNLYIADTGNNRVRMVTALTGIITAVAGGGTGCPGQTDSLGDGCPATSAEFDYPSGVALDGAGDLFVADEVNDRIGKVSVTTTSLSFATTVVGSTSSDSPQTVTLANIGNAPLTLSVPASGDNPSISTNFTLNSSGTSACPLLTPSSSAGTLAAGASCLLPVSFVPTAPGSLAGSLVMTDNNLNVTNATQTISLNGTGVVGTTSSLASSPNPSAFGQSLTFTATVVATSGTLHPIGAVQFSVDGTAAGSPVIFNGVTANGVTASYATSTLTAGTHIITAVYTPAAGSDFLTSSALPLHQVINQVAPTVTWNAPSAITYGTALSATQLDATASVPGTFAYNPALGTVLTAGTHTLGVTFTPTDTTDYQSSTGSTTIKVNQATPTIIWPTPAAIAYGTPLGTTQLNATASTPGTFTYTPPAGTSLTAGPHTLGVSFAPNDATDYTTANGSVTIQVTQATPVITWPSPGNMNYGTPLGSTQLDATATPAGGTFTYNPPAGTTLPIGSQTLSVSYAPTDTIDYTTATATTTVNVISGLTLTAIVPTSAPYGSAATTITLTGIGFTQNSVVKLNGTAIPTTYTSPTQLTAIIPASFFQQLTAGTITVFDTVRNLTSTSATFTVSLPNLQVTFSGPTTAGPGEQPTLNLVVSQPYPIAIQGTMTLTVDPFTAGGPTDPAVQFSTGGTTFSFTIPAGSTTTPTIQLQTGTVASYIYVLLTLQANGQDVEPPSTVEITVPNAVPVISSATITRSGNTLTVTVQGFSSTRNMNLATFDFTPAAGSTISDPKLSVDVTTDFNTWYSSDPSVQYGSSFTYTQVFNLSNNASTIGSVSVVLTNSEGQSNEVTAH